MEDDADGEEEEEATAVAAWSAAAAAAAAAVEEEEAEEEKREGEKEAVRRDVDGVEGEGELVAAPPRLAPLPLFPTICW